MYVVRVQHSKHRARALIDQAVAFKLPHLRGSHAGAAEGSAADSFRDAATTPSIEPSLQTRGANLKRMMKAIAKKNAASLLSRI